MELITMATIGLVAAAGAVLTKARDNSKKIEKLNEKLGTSKDESATFDMKQEKEIDDIISQVQ